MLCDICYLEVSDGVVVPGFGKATGARHKNCIIEAVLKISEDPLTEGMLRRLIECGKSHSVQDWARDVSGRSADACWEWSDVNIPPYKIASFIRIGLVTIVFKTNSSTNYALVGRQLVLDCENKRNVVDGDFTPHPNPLPQGERGLNYYAKQFNLILIQTH